MASLETDETASEALQLPECLTLWRCIGCGSMGNAAECLGACDFRKLDVVSAQEHADLLERLAAITDHVEGLTAIAREIAALAEPARDFERGYRELQTRAREILRSTVVAEINADAESDRSVVWLCACCGQVEAPQPCLGVCIRRDGEFVRGGDHDKLAAAFGSAHRTAKILTAFVRRFAWVSPRAGQWRQTRDAFRRQVIELLQSSTDTSNNFSNEVQYHAASCNNF